MGLILNDISVFIIDCEHKTAPIQQDGYPSIRTPNIGKGNLILNGVNRVSKETYIEWTKRGEPKEGDLIIAREAPVGNVAIIPKNMKVCLGQRTVLVRPNKNIVNPQYLCFLLLSDELQGQILTKTTGATVAHLNMKDIRELKIPKLPNMFNQNKIASILSAYDELIEINHQRIKLLEEMSEEIYKEWFVRMRFPGYESSKFYNEAGEEVPLGTVGALPEGWEITVISDSFQITGGGTPSTSQPEFWEGGNINWYSPTDITGSSSIFLNTSAKKITQLGLNSSSARIFPAKSIMVTSRATIGAVGINLTKACTNQGFIVCIPNKNFSYQYIHQWVSQNKTLIESFSTGATFKEISKKVFKGLKILKPVESISNTYSNLMDPIYNEINILSQKNQILQQTRDLLLPRLMSGKLSVAHLLKEEENISMAAEPQTEYEVK